MPRNLGALAGLAALGAMAANRNKTPDVDTSGVSDMDLTGGARSMTPDTGELRDETGALSKLRRNTETGDLYSPDEPITRPSATSLAKVQKAVRNPGGDMRTMEYRVKDKADSDAMKKAISNANSGKMASQQFPMTKAPDYVPADSKSSNPKEKIDVTKLSLAERRELSKRENSGSGPTDTRSVNERIRSSMGFAKGGVTRSSASTRGDGIATKGHTKGRYL